MPLTRSAGAMCNIKLFFVELFREPGEFREPVRERAARDVQHVTDVFLLQAIHMKEPRRLGNLRGQRQKERAGSLRVMEAVDRAHAVSRCEEAVELQMPFLVPQMIETKVGGNSIDPPQDLIVRGGVGQMSQHTNEGLVAKILGLSRMPHDSPATRVDGWRIAAVEVGTAVGHGGGRLQKRVSDRQSK